MAITINHQTNDISASSGSMTIDGAAAGGSDPGLGSSTSGPSSQGSGSSVTTTAAGLYYFVASAQSNRTSTLTISGATVSGQVWGSSYQYSVASQVTSAGGTMAVGSSSSSTGNTCCGWVKTSGSTTFSRNNGSVSVYKVD